MKWISPDRSGELLLRPSPFLPKFLRLRFQLLDPALQGLPDQRLLLLPWRPTRLECCIQPCLSPSVSALSFIILQSGKLMGKTLPHCAKLIGIDVKRPPIVVLLLKRLNHRLLLLDACAEFLEIGLPLNRAIFALESLKRRLLRDLTRLLALTGGG